MRTARKRLGLSQVEVSGRLGISQGALSKLERGLLVPSAPQWFEFCEITQISVESLSYGYLENLKPATPLGVPESCGYKLGGEYLRHRGSKVRALQPWIYSLRGQLGESRFSKLCKQLRIDPDVFIDYDFQVSLNLPLALLNAAAGKGLLNRESLQDLNRILMDPRTHGSVFERFHEAPDPSQRLVQVIKNSRHYECNFQYELESKKGSHVRQVLVTRPARHLSEIPYREQEQLGDFLCRYKKLYFAAVSVLGTPYGVEIEEKECLFHGAEQCVYVIRYKTRV
jgi:transcriptional regulator with XRE-family HTH domain